MGLPSAGLPSTDHFQDTSWKQSALGWFGSGTETTAVPDLSGKEPVSRETAKVGVAICIKPAKARNEAGYCHGQYTDYQTTVHGTG